MCVDPQLCVDPIRVSSSGGQKLFFHILAFHYIPPKESMWICLEAHLLKIQIITVTI